MIRKEKVGGETVSGLRTRYIPKSRVGHGVVGVAPWFDIVLLLIFFVLLDGKLVLQPGVVIELPETSMSDGFRSELRAVVMSAEGIGSGPREETIFFNDERFIVKDAEQMTKLRNRLAKRSASYPESGLIILADSHVQHGTLVKMFNMAREIGIKRVNIASKTTSGNGRR